MSRHVPEEVVLLSIKVDVMFKFDKNDPPLINFDGGGEWEYNQRSWI